MGPPKMDSTSIFFDGWSKLGRSMILAVLAYAALVILLRVSGKRTLSKMNVFDFVFVVALGSTLASTILSQDISLADGVIAFIALIGLQVLLSWLCTASHVVDRFVNGDPTLLLHQGRINVAEAKKRRVTREEILSAVRSAQLGSLDDIDSIVLETDGNFSIVWQKTDGKRSAMTDVPGHPRYRSDEEQQRQEERDVKAGETVD